MKGGSKSYRKYSEPLKKESSVRKSKSSRDDDCDIEVITNLQKVQIDLASVNVGDIFSVQHISNTLSANNKKKEVIGFITCPHNASIINCIMKGRNFEATVMLISGRTCKVRISNK